MSIKATVRDGVAVISTFNGNTTMAFLGASCRASAMPGTDQLCNITLSPQKGQEAVLALVTHCRYGGKTPDTIDGGLVRLWWQGDKLIVDTDEPFVPSSDRLGQVIPNRLGYGSLHLTTDGQMFAFTFGTYASDHEKEFLKKGGRMVNDANLLCRYLVGQATFEEVQATATGDLRTAEQVRLTELQRALVKSAKEYISLRDEVAIERTECRRFQELLEREHDSNEVLRRELSEALRERNELKVKLNKTLGKRLGRLWEKIRTAPATR